MISLSADRLAHFATYTARKMPEVNTQATLTAFKLLLAPQSKSFAAYSAFKFGILSPVKSQRLLHVICGTACKWKQAGVIASEFKRFNRSWLLRLIALS